MPISESGEIIKPNPGYLFLGFGSMVRRSRKMGGNNTKERKWDGLIKIIVVALIMFLLGLLSGLRMSDSDFKIRIGPQSSDYRQLKDDYNILEIKHEDLVWRKSIGDYMIGEFRSQVEMLLESNRQMLDEHKIFFEQTKEFFQYILDNYPEIVEEYDNLPERIEI